MRLSVAAFLVWFMVFQGVVIAQAPISEDPAAVVTLLYEGGYRLHSSYPHRPLATETATYPRVPPSATSLSKDTTIGKVYASLKLPASRLVSTEYCRTLETARLAFGEPEIISREDLRASLEALLSTPPPPGQNVFIVAHIGTLERATGLDVGEDVAFNEGNALVFKPSGDAYELVARLALKDWAELVR